MKAEALCRTMPAPRLRRVRAALIEAVAAPTAPPTTRAIYRHRLAAVEQELRSRPEDRPEDA